MPKSHPALLTLMLLVGCASPEEAPPPPPPAPLLEVVALEHAEAHQLASELAQLTRFVRVVPDARTNSIILAAESDRELARILAVVERLDVEVPGAR